MRIILASAALGCLVVSLTALGADRESERQYELKRWAVIASNRVRDSGLSELLTVSLSETDGVELVEREQLKLATRELELAAVFGPRSSARRLILGRVLSADALVLVDVQEHQNQRYLKLVTSECKYGARLSVEYLEFAPDRVDALAKACRSAVIRTREQFAGGVRKLIAVNSVSKEQNHSLSSGCASLLASSLSTLPGTAVVEVEEARAISRQFGLLGDGSKFDLETHFATEARAIGIEMKLSLERLDRKIVPLFVDVGLETVDEKPETKSKHRLSIKLNDPTGPNRLVETEPAPVEAIPDLLIGKLSRDIGGVDDARHIPSREQVVKILTDRAQAFSSVGAWKTAAGMREAVLLLKPDDVEQRLGAVIDYDLLIAKHWKEIEPRLRQTAVPLLSRQEQVDLVASLSGRQLTLFRALVHHVEFLVRNDMVNPREAALLTLGSAMDLVSLHRVALVRGNAELRTTAETFFWNVYLKIKGLDFQLRQGRLHPSIHRWFVYTRPGTLTTWRGQSHAEGWTKPKQIDMCASYGTQFIIRILANSLELQWKGNRFILSPTYDDSQTFDRFYRLVTELAPPVIPLRVMATLTCTRYGPYGIFRNRLGPNDAQRFYERLRATKQPINEFYARCGMLGIKVFHAKQIDSRALEEVDELLRWYKSQSFPRLKDRSVEFDARLRAFRSQIVQQLGGVASKKHKLPENWIPSDDPQRRVKFVPIDGLPANALELTKCTDSLDMIRTSDKVYVMPEKGIVRPILIDSIIQDAVWDGERIWIATTDSGIHVLDSKGSRLGQIQDNEGLPISRSVIRLKEISAGRCIAIGQLRKNQRLWFAELLRGGGTYRAEIFHQATIEPPSQTSTRPVEADDDENEIFSPGFFLRYTKSGSPDLDLLLVGRDGGNSLVGRRPLAINLKTHGVEILPVPIWPRALVIADQGHIVAVRGSGITRISPPSDYNDRWTTKVVRSLPISRYTASRFLFRFGGKIISGGELWQLFDDSSQPRLLTPTPLPMRYHFKLYGLSAHYGIVGWHFGDRFFQASIDDSPALSETVDAQFPFIPIELRQRHARAVRAIQRLGGHVASHIMNSIPSSGRPDWHTKVYLSKNWIGGDAGLVHLKDLYRLHILQLVHANIGNDGLKHIGTLNSLAVLDLVETNVTNDGLPLLASLERLYRLRLEGSVGGKQFSDDGLMHLNHLKSLDSLAVYGRQFTDEGLKHLAKLPNLRNLHLYDTAMTRDKLNAFKKKNSPLLWRDYRP